VAGAGGWPMVSAGVRVCGLDAQAQWSEHAVEGSAQTAASARASRICVRARVGGPL